MKRFRQKNRWKKFIRMILILVLGIMFYRASGKFMEQSSLALLEDMRIGRSEADTSQGWHLMLVNQHYYIPDDYKVELTVLSNGEKVDSRIYPKLQEMFDDARANGLELFVREGYRTREEQKQIMDDRIKKYQEEGYSKAQAGKLAKEYVAVPGTSEHELGLSIDINADVSKCSQDALYTWLAENAHKYGFIRRYPPDKTEITGINHEPWHYRYVGQDAANEMKEKNLCLEEYIKQRSF